ncbi:MAG: pilus assembly protein CpaB, partial [Chloroflexota bacterium]|nr:pilus assembly protein CpaB [Chloroflexota bacterium]
MEMEYKDPSKRGRWIVIAGIVLAVAAGGAAFFLINQAQQQAGQGELQKVNVVVAVRPIPVRQPIVAEDLAVRQVPADDTNTDAIAVRDPKDVIGQVLPVTLFQGQMVTRSMLNTTAGGSGGAGVFSILEPGETVAPDSEAWRGVSITVPDDRAVGGLITAGMTVDVLLSAQINVPQDLLAAGKYYTDKSTKIMYQNML